jgi:hypothetical protein
MVLLLAVILVVVVGRHEILLPDNVHKMEIFGSWKLCPAFTAQPREIIKKGGRKVAFSLPHFLVVSRNGPFSIDYIG